MLKKTADLVNEGTPNFTHFTQWSQQPFARVPKFFIQAHFCENMGTFFGKNKGKFQVFVISSSLCDLVQSVIGLLAKQLNNTLNLH